MSVDYQEVETFLELNAAGHSHLESEHAIEFFRMISEDEKTAADHRSVEVQVIVAGCLVCAAVLGGCNPSRAANGYNKQW